MDDPGSAGKGGGTLSSGNGADFVKKLYRMLADKTHSNVVRWSDHGKSFIVFDNNDFTKNVLPQHFKHSNFASFVRQLNKYDFHKVRASEDSLAGPNGDQAWEFVHPQFRLGNDNNLDGIKRKAPSQRPKKELDEPQTTVENSANIQQLQSRLDDVFRRVEGMVSQYHNAVSEILNLNRRMHRTEEMLEKIVYFQQNGHYPQGGPPGPPPGMHPEAYLDAHGHPAHPPPPHHMHERMMGHPGGPPPGGPPPPPQVAAMHGYPGGPPPPPPGSHGGPVTPVQQAAERYSVREMPPGGPASLGPYGDSGTPIPDAVHLSGFGNTASMSGIALDATDPQVSTTFRQDVRRPQGLRKKSTGFVAPKWREQPKILLVEDDPTCRKIGLKFLEATGCLAYHASDGYEAIRKFNDANGPKYDLILMDIVMPHLDGVSTTQIIRNAKPDMKDPPIIAMTSNIRTSDINLYFQGGMIDVLPKPFTKDGLRQMLEKYLSRLHTGGSEEPPLPSKGLAMQSLSGAFTPNTNKAESTKQSTSPILKTEYDNTTNSHGDENDDDDDDGITGTLDQDTPHSSVVGMVAAAGIGGVGGGSVDGNGDYTFTSVSGDDLTPSNSIGPGYGGGGSPGYENGMSAAGSSRTLRRPPEGFHDDYADGRMKRMKFNAS